MPVYCYKCNSCEASFEARHSMSFEEQVCIECGSGDVFKVPHVLDIKNNLAPQRTGKIVDDYIKDAKQDLKNEKKDLRSKEL